MPVELPSYHSPHEAVVLREEITLSQLSLEVEIDQFRLEEEGKEQEEPMIQVSDSEGKLDKSSIIHSPKFVVAQVDDLKEEEEMALNRRKGLKKLLAKRNNGLTPKDASGSQPLLALPLFAFFYY